MAQNVPLKDPEHISIQKSITEKILDTSPCFPISIRELNNVVCPVSGFFIAPEEQQPVTFPDNLINIKIYMRGGSAALLPAKYKFKKVCPTAGSWGTVATSTPRKSDENGSKKGGFIGNEQNEPMVAFSKPPPQPSFLGPLLAFSLFETWSRHDTDDN
ncbi:uncharacterized protein LOC120214263 [Hibiscus syriacus]|uniref:uncharacterized protein LOC120214263 n=1 Tax=Hibiscus syriacus TaxID=106335 RepID=UPI0019220C92|nr:uncharacterized protein LOC120214263 [Hibiscus syriacus]